MLDETFFFEEKKYYINYIKDCIFNEKISLFFFSFNSYNYYNNKLNNILNKC